jgi:pimeloyl-ACP methyl ester carboxylesterase
MKVYFISGLAADSRVFKHIQLPVHCEAVFVDWITPEKNESLRRYSLRLATKINTREPFAIIGLSMGGMITAEIIKLHKPVVAVLISSIPSSKQLPVYFKIAGKLKLYKIVPVSFAKSMSVMKRLFTTETRDDKSTLKQIIRESDPAFIRWAMGAILNWKSETPPETYVHIHGSKDEVLPLRFTNPTHVIQKAGHLMVMNRAKEINAILQEVLPV